MKSLTKAKPMIFMRKHSSSILTGISITGVAATGYLSAKGGASAERILRDYDDGTASKTYEPLTFKERLRLTWKCYISGVVAGALTIGAMACNQYMSAKQIAALTSSVAMLVAGRDQLEDQIRKKYGDKALDELKRSLKIRNPDKEYIYVYAEETGKGNLLCYEGFSGRWFRSEEDEVRRNIEEFSNRFKAGDAICWNDFYDILGIEQSHFGFEYGYPAGESADDWYDREDGIPMYVSRFYNPDLEEDVLYIDLGKSATACGSAVYPIECWYEY